MKTILIPTDFSSCAENSADFACELAVKNMVDVCLLHTYFTPYSNAGAFLDYSEMLRTVSKDLMDKEVLRLLEKYPEMKNCAVEIFNATEKISQIANYENAIKDLRDSETLLNNLKQNKNKNWEK